MNSRMILRTLRPAVAVVAVAAFSACSRDDITPLGGNPTTPDLAIGFEVSSARAKVGEQVAVTVRADALEPLGALQGYVRFDPSVLEYVGQAPEGRTMVMVNSSRAAQGELRVASLNVETGLPPRTGTLVFEVKKPDYSRSLRYSFETAGDKKATKAFTNVRLTGTVLDVADLAVPEHARPMSLADWNQLLYPAAVEAAHRLKPATAGQYLLNLRYGNADLSAEGPPGGTTAPCTSVNVLDASYIANAAVGNINILHDTIIGGINRPRDGVVAANVFPNSSPVPGVEANGTRRLDVLDASAVANAAVGNQRPPVCTNIPGREALPTARDSITANITADATWDNTQVHVLDGFIRVRPPATLTIMPGTRIEGNSNNNPSGLLIERGAKIVAVGNSNQPIVFTCNSPTKFKGCWAGLILTGFAPINTNQAATTATSSDGGCLETPFEGVSGTAFDFSFGGCTANDSSGALKYVRVEYGGFVFTANKEINNLTLAGVGSRTVIDFVQAHAGKDDGLELFGGTVNVRHYLATANQDDSYDFASGWTGNAQFLIIQHDSIDSDKGFEIDNTETGAMTDDTPCNPDGSGICTTRPAAPRTRGTIFNVTMIGRQFPTSLAATSSNPCTGGTFNTSTPRFAGGDVSCGAIHLRRGARPTLSNIVAEGWRYLLDLDDGVTALGDSPADFTTVLKVGPIAYNNIFRLDEPDAETGFGPYTPTPGGSIEDDYLTDATRSPLNQASATEMLRDPYNVMTPDFRPLSAAAVGSGDTPPSNGFFDVSATYKGAVAPDGFGLASIPWYAGWTRGWADGTNP
jgi:hypothetical protein